MKLIIGLGNPGKEYEKTRHNVGFMVLDEIKIEDPSVKLVKPQDFMNESGRTVSKEKNYYKVENNDIWVIHDDVDLEFGKVRVQKGGSSAGHNGIQSVIDSIGEDFWRIRVGIGKPASPAGGGEKIPTDKWVLSNFTSDEEKRLNFILDQVADLVVEYISNGIKEETFNYKNY